MRPSFYKLLILSALFLSSPAFAKLNVLTSFSLLADLTSQVGQDLIHVDTLIAKGSSVHVYQPNPAAVKKLQSADIFIVNGLGLEGWLERLLEASNFKGKVVVASTGIAVQSQSLIRFAPKYDPHAWHNLANAIIYVQNISQALCAADQDHCVQYQTYAARYQLQLSKLDSEFRQQLKAIPKERRFVVSNHMALAYMGRAYDIGIIAVQGFSNESQPSARDLALVISHIRNKKITTIFYENLSDQRMSQQIARETNTKLGAPLFVDNLDSKPPADDFIGMMRSNFAHIIAAMRTDT